MNAAKRKASRLMFASIMTFMAGAISLNAPMNAYAATTTQNSTPAARISFTFDDGLASTYSNAAPILAQYGLTGTEYIPTSCIASSGTCPENSSASYMTWPQVQALQNSYGWEIGSHSVNTPCLASSALTDPADCPNPVPLTTAQIDAELANSQSTLASYGINATDFAPPFGDYNANVIAQIAKYYASMKQFKNAANSPNTWPYSDYYLQDYPVLETTTPVSGVETAINNAITNNQWLILTFHDILSKPSRNPDNYEYGTAELAQIAAYVQSEQAAGKIQSVHVNQGLVTSSTNLLPNGNFSAGISGGWTTPNPTAVTADTGNNGSYPNPTNSIKFVANTVNNRLYSPKVSVTPGTTYMLKNFLNVQSLKSGDVEFYIDEYDVNGNWISGQYKGAENSSFAEDMNYTYKPSSPVVTSADLQVTVIGNSGITAYLANSQWFPLTSATTTQTNLVANGTFDAGISGGWTTDSPTNITADSGNNGSPANPVNSVKMLSSTKNIHLFSPQVAVASTKSYSLSSYLNLKQITGTNSEVGFYIDEYNTSGTWISGQYKVGDHTVGANNIGFTYTPSSANVTKASLQVIVVANSSITAYLDNVQWFAN
jgi:peptidoglycan/xylan/chitin deacetylase (PgdA/CDA1 family)